ncbi:helix-turn-helix domain-containing protein [uncultured Kordia sp.]|uniref:helix-turn-helix domain-containing protein n=1 Tax=uncultured Kordia sp. TaxID=507699 RepID=UPI0026364AB1|nr:helix-turn-helix domain-containing protein [uncultured Kordia sp.]
MKKTLRFPFTLLFLFFCTVSFAQLDASFKIPDSLKGKSNKELHAIIRPHIYKTKTYADAKLYVDVLLLNGLREKDHLEQARAYNYYYRILVNTGFSKEALIQVSKSIDIAETNKYEAAILRTLYGNKGVAYFNLGDYENAIHYYVKEAELTDNYHAELIINYNIGLLKLNMGDKKDALKRFKSNDRAYDSLIKLGEDVFEDKNLNLMGVGKAYTSFKKLDSALYTYKEAYNYSKDKFPVNSAFYSGGIGNVYSLQKKYKEAIPYLEISERLSDSLMIVELTPYIHLHKGRVYNGLKQHAKAIEILKKVDSAIIQGKRNSVELQECYALLANSYYAIKDHKSATENYEKFIAVDRENDGKKADVINTIYNQYDLKTLETQIKDLAQETDDQKQMLSSTKIMIILLMLVILFLFGYYQYKARQNQKRFEALLNKSKSPTSVKKLKTVAKTKKIDRKKLIPEEKAQELLKKLQKLEQQEAFLNQNCTIAWLAKKMGTNASYASIIINDYRQKKFPEYLSELRINYATERLQEDSKFRSYTIKSIASDVGYKSAEAFSKTFKKINGIYPSYFIKKLNQKAQNAA